MREVGTMAYTLSLHNGSAVCQKHNNRDKDTIAKEEHIDPTGEHITLRHLEIRKAYYQFFGKALDDYNKKIAKKNPDRIKTMQQYINEIFAKKDTLKQSTKPAYEMILQIGDKDNAPDDETCKTIFEEYLNEFENTNKSLKVIGAYIHNDEKGGIHMHLDYIPYARCSRGMALQPSLSKALEQLGYESKNHKDTMQMQFQKAERERLTQICNIYGLEIEAVKGGKNHLETEVYKLKQEINNLDIQKEELQIDNIVLSQQIDDIKIKLAELEKKFSDTENENDGLAIINNQLLEDIERSKKELNVLKIENEKIKTMLKDGKKNLEKCASALIQAEKLDKSKLGYSPLTEYIDDLRDAYNSIDFGR